MIRQDLEKRWTALRDWSSRSSSIEDILPFIPRELRWWCDLFWSSWFGSAVGIYICLKATTGEEKDLVALDAMNIMIKLFDEEVLVHVFRTISETVVWRLWLIPEGRRFDRYCPPFYRWWFCKKYKRPRSEKIPLSPRSGITKWRHAALAKNRRWSPYFAAKIRLVRDKYKWCGIWSVKRNQRFDICKVMQEGKNSSYEFAKGDVGEINTKLLGIIIVQ